MFITQIKVSRIIEMNFIFYESKSDCEKQDNKPTALEWADKTMLEKVCEYAQSKYDLDYCGDVKDILNYLKSLVED